MTSSHMTRRRFFQGAGALGAALLPGWSSPASPSRASGAQEALTTGPSQTASGRPVFLSTWKHGKPANEKAAEVLASGGSLMDAIEKGINIPELDPEVMSVGYGAIPNEEGVLQLDAIIMDGASHRAGAVAALEMIPTPISVARRVMEKTRHTLLAGAGALQFAIKEGFE
ncbi:MAG: isoaspartyl peptidase/L-asparaginase, partial [Candidatus Acidiferrales bacterium]